MSDNERRLFKEPKVFDADFTLRFSLMLLIAAGIVFLSWTYSFKSNIILELNESNEQVFNEKFDELSGVSGWGDYRNMSVFGQQKIVPKEIDRSNYTMDRRAFASLPLIPSDWGKIKLVYDSGRMFILRNLDAPYYLQPEFYDDWYYLGMPFFEKHDRECTAGMFGDPYVQKIYTRVGASIETYTVVRSSFCVSGKQAVQLAATYPSEMVALANENYRQDPDVVRKYITLKIEPNSIILGSVYPKFSKDWAQKIKVTIEVAGNTPKGIYVVALGTDKYVPWFTSFGGLNYEAFKSKNGAPLAHYIIAVD